MALKDRLLDDLLRVFLNAEHFATTHNWNGTDFLCVTDEEAALKRKNNNVVDISWDNNTHEILVYVAKTAFPGTPVVNQQELFDGMPMKLLQVQEDMGMLAILFVANYVRVD